MKKIFLLALSIIILTSCISSQENAHASPYDDIIKKYTEMLELRISDQTVSEPAYPSEVYSTVYSIAVNCEDPRAMGYATKDIDRDGNEELVLLNRSNELYAIFTHKDGVPILLFYADGMSCGLSPDGTLNALKYEPNHSSVHVRKLVNGSMTGTDYVINVIDDKTAICHKIEDGIRTEITYEEWYKVYDSMQATLRNFQYMTKTVGFRFIPAIETEITNDSPTPDFSSYEGILDAYKIIVESFSEYDPKSWYQGDFDGIFTIKDNQTYDIFHSLFSYGKSFIRWDPYYSSNYAKDGDNAYGYAKKDLNGDGIEELILLSDNYDIIAVFTESNGIARYVEGSGGVWIDENAYLRKTVFTGGDVYRDREHYLYEFDGTRLVQKVGVGYNVNFYLNKENWYETDGRTKTPISDAEGKALFEIYDILPLGVTEEEYTKSFSGIEFYPLFYSTAPNEKHLDTFSKMEIVNGNTLTVSEFTDKYVSFSITFVHSVGEYDPETGEIPEVYHVKLVCKATLNGNKYYFEAEGVTGYIEFAVNSVWVTVTESKNEHVACMSYLFDYPETR